MKLEVTARRWPLREPFVVSREIMTTVNAVIVTLTDGEHAGRGEAYGLPYEGETVDGIVAQLEQLRPQIAAGVDRSTLPELLPHGGARCALDCALWDLEAKRSGKAAHVLAGFPLPRTVETAFTIGIRAADAVRETAANHAAFSLLKLKVSNDDPMSLVRAAREGAPRSRFIVDPNQSWSIEDVVRLAPELDSLGVVLLEQPLPVGSDDGLASYNGPVPVCADELIHDTYDLHKAVGKYSYINIKLDKAGGLTEALSLAHEAIAQGFRLMVGCMAGSSLAMAPAHLVAQLCDFVDLDGPLLQSEDWPNCMTYENGLLHPPSPALWG